MKALVFGGSGRIGSAVAWDLARDPAVTRVGLVGRRRRQLDRVKRWIDSDKITCHVLDVDDRPRVRKLMQQYDAGALALPDRRTSYMVAHAAVEVGLSIVDMLEEYHRRPDASELEGLQLPPGLTLDGYGDWLHETAIASGATFVDGMGFAPGLANVTIGEAIRKLDVAERAVARVGGIPSKQAAARHPLRYMITWSLEHVLREYMVRVEIRRDGELVEVDAGSERESFRFNRFGQDELLECAITPGMPSVMSSRPQLQAFAEKTVRWPGHWQSIEVLRDCGMLDLEAVSFEGCEISPREFLVSRLTPRLLPKPGDTDVCVMYNTVRGLEHGKPTTIEHFMWHEGDGAGGMSAMMRVTGFSAAIATKMLLDGSIDQPGIIPPEDAIGSKLYPRFIAELEKRNIRVLEEVRAEGTD